MFVVGDVVPFSLGARGCSGVVIGVGVGTGSGIGIFKQFVNLLIEKWHLRVRRMGA